ncbi:MAG: toprim domain-containing protein, partial [Muribaculaceae bacterium]|nr:toprim domain-containing protein [Muribaculaceae bacterium]
KEACDAFHLGYAIDKGDALVNEAKKSGLNIEILKKTGLVGQSQEGRIYDKYRGRVIFPILNTAGKVIGFGGRTLKNDKAKYINSPESEIYKKSNELYGIFQARTSIGKEDKCFLVEGYFDVIGMWQSGMKNVVASSGTALTDGQIALIHRFTENITLIYDGDKAGIKAALRGVDMLLHHKMKVKVLLLPDGDDPDSFARKHTPEEFREFVNKNETDVITFKAKVLVNDIKEDPQGRINAVQDMVTTLAHISDPISRDVYIQECSMLMRIPEETILKSVIRKRSELVEQWKREKMRKNLSNFSPENRENANSGTNSTPPSDSHSNAPQESSQAPDEAFFHGLPVPDNSNSRNEIGSTVNGNTNSARNVRSPLYPLEKRLMEFVVKYGYIPFCKDEQKENDNQSNSESWINIAEFIYNELLSDGVEIKDRVFSEILAILLKSKSRFEQAFAKRIEEIQETISGMRKEGFDKIAQKDLTVNEIQREEKLLEEELKVFETNEIRDFEKNYPAHILSNHENEEIRETATQLLIERHQLSNIFYRDNVTVETEEDRLYVLVPRTINELKSEIITNQVKELFNKLATVKDRDEEILLQKEINEKIMLRAILARNLGERIVTTVVIKR